MLSARQQPTHGSPRSLWRKWRREVSVDVLTSPEEIDGLDQPDPKRYGMIIRAGGRVGGLLPDIPQVETAKIQVGIARRKAWHSP